jgi:hypothetical protein
MNVMPIAVPQNAIRHCKFCGADVFWLVSRRTGKSYPVNVDYAMDHQPATFKTNFHRCDPSAKSQFKRVQVEQAGQMNLNPAAQAQAAQPTPPATYTPAKDTWVAKKEAMQEFLAKANASQLLSALTCLFHRQTLSEQAIEGTTDLNDVGFGHADAEFLSNVCKKATQWGGLRGKQPDAVRKSIRKYWKQLVIGLQQGEWKI